MSEDLDETITAPEADFAGDDAADAKHPKRVTVKIRKISDRDLLSMIAMYEAKQVPDSEEVRAFIEKLKQERDRRLKYRIAIKGRRGPKVPRGERHQKPKRRRR